MMNFLRTIFFICVFLSTQIVFSPDSPDGAQSSSPETAASVGGAALAAADKAVALSSPAPATEVKTDSTNQPPKTVLSTIKSLLGGAASKTATKAVMPQSPATRIEEIDKKLNEVNQGIKIIDASGMEALLKSRAALEAEKEFLEPLKGQPESEETFKKMKEFETSKEKAATEKFNGYFAKPSANFLPDSKESLAEIISKKLTTRFNQTWVYKIDGILKGNLLTKADERAFKEKANNPTEVQKRQAFFIQEFNKNPKKALDSIRLIKSAELAGSTVAEQYALQRDFGFKTQEEFETKYPKLKQQNPLDRLSFVKSSMFKDEARRDDSKKKGDVDEFGDEVLKTEEQEITKANVLLKKEVKSLFPLQEKRLTNNFLEAKYQLAKQALDDLKKEFPEAEIKDILNPKGYAGANAETFSTKAASTIEAKVQQLPENSVIKELFNNKTGDASSFLKDSSIPQDEKLRKAFMPGYSSEKELKRMLKTSENIKKQKLSIFKRAADVIKKFGYTVTRNKDKIEEIKTKAQKLVNRQKDLIRAMEASILSDEEIKNMKLTPEEEVKIKTLRSNGREMINTLIDVKKTGGIFDKKLTEEQQLKLTSGNMQNLSRKQVQTLLKRTGIAPFLQDYQKLIEEDVARSKLSLTESKSQGEKKPDSPNPSPIPKRPDSMNESINIEDNPKQPKPLNDDQKRAIERIKNNLTEAISADPKQDGYVMQAAKAMDDLRELIKAQPDGETKTKLLARLKLAQAEIAEANITTFSQDKMQEIKEKFVKIGQGLADDIDKELLQKPQPTKPANNQDQETTTTPRPAETAAQETPLATQDSTATKNASSQGNNSTATPRKTNTMATQTELPKTGPNTKADASTQTDKPVVNKPNMLDAATQTKIPPEKKDPKKTGSASAAEELAAAWGAETNQPKPATTSTPETPKPQEAQPVQTPNPNPKPEVSAQKQIPLTDEDALKRFNSPGRFGTMFRKEAQYAADTGNPMDDAAKIKRVRQWLKENDPENDYYNPTQKAQEPQPERAQNQSAEVDVADKIKKDLRKVTPQKAARPGLKNLTGPTEETEPKEQPLPNTAEKSTQTDPKPVQGIPIQTENPPPSKNPAYESPRKLNNPAPPSRQNPNFVDPGIIAENTPLPDKTIWPPQPRRTDNTTIDFANLNKDVKSTNTEINTNWQNMADKIVLEINQDLADDKKISKKDVLNFSPATENLDEELKNKLAAKINEKMQSLPADSVLRQWYNSNNQAVPKATWQLKDDKGNVVATKTNRYSQEDLQQINDRREKIAQEVIDEINPIIKTYQIKQQLTKEALITGNIPQEIAINNRLTKILKETIDTKTKALPDNDKFKEWYQENSANSENPLFAMKQNPQDAEKLMTVNKPDKNKEIQEDLLTAEQNKELVRVKKMLESELAYKINGNSTLRPNPDLAEIIRIYKEKDESSEWNESVDWDMKKALKGIFERWDKDPRNFMNRPRDPVVEKYIRDAITADAGIIDFLRDYNPPKRSLKIPLPEKAVAQLEDDRARITTNTGKISLTSQKPVELATRQRPVEDPKKAGFWSRMGDGLKQVLSSKKPQDPINPEDMPDDFLPSTDLPPATQAENKGFLSKAKGLFSSSKASDKAKPEQIKDKPEKPASTQSQQDSPKPKKTFPGALKDLGNFFKKK